MFNKEKQIQLSRADFSKKGSIDSKIKKLVDKINSKKDYYTTSSCSGRIMLIAEGKTKRDAKWIFVSHNKAKLAEMKKSLKKMPKETLWFKFEPMILHVCCDSIDSAQKMVDLAKQSGFKHSGIMSSGKRIIAELRGTDFISAPVAFSGKMSVDNNYLKRILIEANKKLEKNYEKIKKFMACF